MEGEGFLLKLFNLGGLGLDDLEFTGEVSNLKLKQANVFKSLSVLDLTLRQSALEDLNLLVEESQLVIPSDQLST